MVDFPVFIRYIHDVFHRMDDSASLARHPLRNHLTTDGQIVTAETLRQILLQAIAELCPPRRSPSNSMAWRRWRCLTLRYVDGESMKQIGQILGISDRQARRDHLAGLDAVASILWTRYCGYQAVDDDTRRSPVLISNQVNERRPWPGSDLEVEVARISAGRATSLTDLSEVMESSLQTAHNLIETRRARVETTLTRYLAPVMIDPAVLRQILLCLLTAALQAQVAPCIKIRAQESKSRVTLILESRGGPLVEMADRDSAGEIVRLIETTRQLAETQGATLRVDDPSDGGRHLILDLVASPYVTVLVIDDNPDVVQLFRRYLDGTRYRLVQARTPRTALRMIHEIHPDVITLDVMMPSQDGWQILQQLRRDLDIHNIPIIVCSILPERALALSLGATDFLAKPVMVDDLLTVLDRHTY